MDLVNHSESSISSERKIKRNLETSSNRWPHIVPKTRFQGRLGDVLWTSLGRPKTFSQGRPLYVRWGRRLDVRLGRPQEVVSRRPQDVKSERPREVSSECPQDGQIGSLGDVLGMLEGDVLGTSWGPVFAFWVNEQLPIFLIQISVTESIPAGIAINLHSFL